MERDEDRLLCCLPFSVEPSPGNHTMSNIMAEAAAESEDRRREFRQYLVDGGVLDAVVKAVVTLYSCEDKPINPVDFVRKVMGDQRPSTEDMTNLISEVKDSLQVQRVLAQDNQRLRERLQELEPDSDLLVSSVVPPELLLPEEEEQVEDEEKPPVDADAGSNAVGSDLQMLQGEQFQPRKEDDEAEPEVSERGETVDEPQVPQPEDGHVNKPAEETQHAETKSVASESLHAEAKSILSEAASEKKSAAALEESEEPPAVAASDGGQALVSEEEAAPLH